MYSYLTDEDKVFIISNYESKSFGRIGQILNRSKQTVWKFFQKWKTFHKLASLNPRTGRKLKLSKESLNKSNILLGRILVNVLRTFAENLISELMIELYQNILKGLAL